MTDSEIIELLQMQLKTQQQQNEFLQKTIESLNQNIQSQTETIETLTEKIADLEEKLKKNSRNSSKPPSSDGYSKPNPKSLRPKSEKKAGGQKGHKSSNLSVPKKIDRTVSHYPARCEKCPLFEKCRGTVCVPAEKRYTVDIIVKTDVVEHQVFRMNGCSKHGGMHRGEFPEGVNAYIQYGQNLSSLLVNLSMDGMSADHLHKTIGRMFDIPLSTGTIINKLEKCAGLVSPLMDRIKEKIVHGPVAHFDETGIRVDGRTKWVHSSSNRDFTYLTLSEKRGKDGMDENGVLPDFKGIAVHDCWKAYWRYFEATHAICAVHILRELVGVIENHPHQRWAKMFRDMLHELYRLKKSYADCGRTRLDTCYLDYYSLKYDEIIGIARKENPPPLQTEIKRGRKKKGKVLALIERLAQLKDSMLLFARNFEVPFTNNAAERTIRNLKSKSKVAGNFRSDDGARWYLKIRSYIDSARKHGINAFEAVKLAFAGTPALCLGF